MECVMFISSWQVYLAPHSSQEPGVYFMNMLIMGVRWIVTLKEKHMALWKFLYPLLIDIA